MLASGGYEEEFLYYDMKHQQRGKLLIFNNQNFICDIGRKSQSSNHCESNKHQHFSKRVGSDRDAALVSRSFRKLGFNAEMHKDKTALEMHNIIKKEAKGDHSDEDCFAIFILTYGNEGFIYGADELELVLDTLIAEMKTCETLVGKPKLIFVDATHKDKGLHDQVRSDGEKGQTSKKKIPIEADFLYSYSTIQGFQSESLRTSNNDSLYVNTLCSQLDKFGREKEISQILTKVNAEVVKKEKNPSEQMPSFVSMLRKQVYFPKVHSG